MSPVTPCSKRTYLSGQFGTFQATHSPRVSIPTNSGLTLPSTSGVPVQSLPSKTDSFTNLSACWQAKTPRYMPSASCRPARHSHALRSTTSEDADALTACRELPEAFPPELHDSEESYHAKSNAPSLGMKSAEVIRPVPSTTVSARASPQEQPKATPPSSLIDLERPYPVLSFTHSPRFMESTYTASTVPSKVVPPEQVRPRYTENFVLRSASWHAYMVWKAPSLNCVAAWQVHLLKSAGVDDAKLQPPSSSLLTAQSAEDPYHAKSVF
mmetsp:Transcript_66688/g.192663  ORF Transcript_66688/g.192663 Transcript_66688/m.192663 type:complete len:269 (-) Transcript_66688:219-1025(-)